MKSDYVLEVNGLNKCYGGFTAVKNVCFEVPRGEVFALLGHNGAGKSTVIKMILGLVNPSGGQIVIDGYTYRQKPLETKMKIGYLPERMNFYDNLTAWETLRFYGKLKGLPGVRCEEVLEQVGLKEAKHKRVGTFSKGMQQRLGLAQAIIHRPQLLILDEPTTGLDPSGVWWLKKMIRDWNGEGTTIFFSSHNLGDVQELAHRVAIMCRGEMVVTGTIPQLQSQFDLKARMKIKLADQYSHPWLTQLTAKGLGHMEAEQNQFIIACDIGEKGRLLEKLLAEGIQITDFNVEDPGLDMIYQEVMKRTEISPM